MKTFVELFETKERLQNKVDLLVGKSKGNVDVMRVFELADSLDLELTKRQAVAMIKKAKNNYGY